MPHYMHKDMRKKGYVTFGLKVRSNIQKYLSDEGLQKVKEPNPNKKILIPNNNTNPSNNDSHFVAEPVNVS
jgi:hypothetical protein